MHLKSLLGVGGMAFVLSLVACGVQAEEYRDAERHFTVTIPEGWEQASPKLVEAANQLVQQRMPGSGVLYTVGFQPKGTLPGQYPYILVQDQPFPSALTSYDELEKGLGAGIKQAEKETRRSLADIAKEIGVGENYLDRSKNRLVMRTEMEAPNVGKIQGISIGPLGKRNMILLHCYALVTDFPKYQATFEKMADSFHYDAGYAFQSKEAGASSAQTATPSPSQTGASSPSKAPSSSLQQSIVRNIVVALIGVGVVILVERAVRASRARKNS